MGEIVRDAGEAFIGKPISGPFLAALESAIDTNLQRALKRGAIRSYDFADVIYSRSAGSRRSDD